MEASVPTKDIFTRLAVWAASCLASSVFFVLMLLFLWFGIEGMTPWMRDHPQGAVSVALMFISYVTAFVCLYKLQKRGADRIPLWTLSLIATCVPLAVIGYWFGAKLGLAILALAEILAAVLQIVAIGISLSRRSVSAA